MTRIVGLVGLAAAADRRDAGELVAVGQHGLRVAVLAVPGEPDRRPARARGPGSARRAPASRPRSWRRRPARARPRACRPARAGSRTTGPGRASPGQPRYAAMSRPSPTGRIVALKRGSARTRGVERPERRRVARRAGRACRRTPRRTTGRCRRRRWPPAAAGARSLRGRPGTRALRASMNAKSNGPTRAGSSAPSANASSAGRLTTTIRSSATPAWRHQPRATVGPAPVRIDRRDRRVRCGSERHPQGRVAVRRADLDDPLSAGRQDREDPARLAIEDRDPVGFGGGLDRGERGGDRRGDRLDPGSIGCGRDVPVGGAHRGVSFMSARQTSRPAPKYRPAATMVAAAMTPTLMYSRPVADSIERVRAVWIAAHDTTSGKTSPTMSRSQTNSAHGPGERRERTAARAGAESDRDDEEHELECDDREEQPGEHHERRLGQLRRHEVPVAEDHRGEHAAGGRRQEQALAEEWDEPREPAAPAERAEHERSDTGDDPGHAQPDRPTAAGQHDRVQRGDRREQEQAGLSGAVVCRVDVDRRGATDPGRQRPVGQVGEKAEARGAGGREREIAARRVGPGAGQDDGRERAEPERGEDRPVDEREVLGDPLGRHAPSVAGRTGGCRRPLLSAGRGCPPGAEVDHGTRARYDHHLVRPRLRRAHHARREDDPHRPVVRQPTEPETRRPGRPLRSPARDPRPRRPHGRGGVDRQPAPAGLAVHPRDEPVAGPSTAWRR